MNSPSPASLRLIGPGRRPRFSIGAVTVCSAGAALFSGVWALAGFWITPPRFIATLTPATPDRAVEIEAPELDPEIYAVTLFGELFPKPAADSALTHAEPPRSWEVELRALVNPSAADGYAFIYDPKAKHYLAIRIGETAPGGAVLASMDHESATFDLDGHSIRRMLAP